MNTNNKYICIHGHFYQPPRENAWLEVIEQQESATPFHDWNERINYECYAPNTAARILDSKHRITKIVNNYAKISYNFGPTLLSWLLEADPATYHAILNADKISQARYAGHGSALAQVYNHIILPLANSRDKETQIIWGIHDFEHRFGRKPQGMWLSETAVDIESLELLVKHGIHFTILAPNQVKAIRKIGENEWYPVPAGVIDSRRPYLCVLPSGAEITLFFYNGHISQAVAFEGLLHDGKKFARRLLGQFDDNDVPQLCHVATDGETYGHHHRFGEMALADCLSYIEETNQANLINYGSFLEKFPPTYQAQIHENSSWSCVHGVERWKSDCGCSTGGRPSWNQKWRGPLRETLNWLRDQLIPIFDRLGNELIVSADVSGQGIWKVRNDYISVILDRSPENIAAFMKRHAVYGLSEIQQTQLLRLLEMQRQAMLMFTSCGWFFDEISGIETDQILQYALRAINYAQQVAGIDFHPEFLERLRKAPSNSFENGASSYEKNVIPSQVDLVRVGMHYAATSLFEAYPEHLEFLNYIADAEEYERIEGGLQKLSLGRIGVRSKITHSTKQFSFMAFYLGQHHILGHIFIDLPQEDFAKLGQAVKQAFSKANLAGIMEAIEMAPPGKRFSVWSLFRDEQQKILSKLVEQSLLVVEDDLRYFYADNYQLMSILQQSNLQLPPAFLSSLRFVLNQDLLSFFKKQVLEPRELQRITGEFKKWLVDFDNLPNLQLQAGERIFIETTRLTTRQMDVTQLDKLNHVLSTIQQLGLQVNYWKSQNVYYQFWKGLKNGEWDFPHQSWENSFQRLGVLLNFAH